jgi:opacity protein-like surface antigen
MALPRFCLAAFACLSLTACTDGERSRLIVGGGLAAGMAMEKADELAATPGVTLRDFSESSDLGYVARVHGGVQISRGWAAIVELEYTDVTFNLEGRDVEATELSTFGSLRYTLEIDTPLRPYVKAGIGYAKSFEGNEDTSFGAKGAVGVEFALSEAMVLYGEAQYSEYFSPTYSITGVGVESESSTVGLHGGVELRF